MAESTRTPPKKRKTSRVSFNALSVIASREYDRDKLPLHRFGRALSVMAKARELARAIPKGVNIPIISHAALFMYAGYHENHSAKGYPDKESYSAGIAHRTLTSLGYSNEHADAVASCILALHKDAVPETADQKILRAAELSTLTGSRASTMQAYGRWKKELAKQGQHLGEAEYRSARVALLNHHLEHDGKWVEHFIPGFRKSVQRNVNAFYPPKRVERRRRE